ncbi:MAG TPA: TolC family protein [Candidatus Binataceae bacterium]|nr:TolC family protein [Candidatus Binataceae bacterium]
MAAKTITLDEAISRALKLAPALDSAVAQSDLNRARVDEARAPLFPSVAGNSEYYQPSGYDKTISNDGLTQAQLALTYTAFDGGRRLAQLRAAHYASQAAALGIAAAQAQIVFDTTIAYFDLLRQRDTETELNTSLSRLSKYVNLVEALRRSGRAIANDVLTLRVTRDATELSLASAHQTASEASVVLGSMIGDYDDTILIAAEVSGLTRPPNGDLTGNPAFKAAARQLQAAKLTVDAARAERYPNLNLALTTGWQGVNPPKTFGHHFGASYDGVLSVPIFQGGLVRSHIDQALAGQLAADSQQRAIELQVKRDLATARLRYDSAIGQLAILRRSQQSATDAFALAWTRFLGGGNVTVLEVTNAYQQAENLRIARLDQEFNARQAAAQVRMLLGMR